MKKLFILLVLSMLTFFFNEAKAQSDTTFHMSYSPNPFEDQLNITIHPGNKNVRYIKVYDVIGKEAAHFDLNHKNTPFTFSIDLSDLRPGIYLLNVYTDKGIIESRKIFRTR